MSPVIAVIHHHDEQVERFGSLLLRRGIQTVSWRGFGGAHDFIVRRRPDLVLLCTERGDREPALRLIEELTWDPETRDIPVILEPERKAEESDYPTVTDRLDELLILIVGALAQPHSQQEKDPHFHRPPEDDESLDATSKRVK